MAENREIVNSTNNNKEGQSNNVDRHLDEATPPLDLDLGDDLLRTNDTNRLGGCSSNTTNTGAELSNNNRREDNPFSFKHFLRCDSTNYQNKGARPKVYCDGRPISGVSDLELPQNNGVSPPPPATSPGTTRPTGTKSKQTRLVSEYSSAALPDFVQDHIVVEQCYLGNNTNSKFNLDINLPDFTPNRNNSNINRINIESSQRCDDNDPSIPLDLPIRRQQQQQNGFPLDLPIGGETSQHNSRTSCPPTEVGVSKSLPDFLTDGAVRTEQQQSDSSSVESPERECERLRRELDIARQQLAAQTMCIENLTKDLDNARSREREYTENLTRALEQVEENLQRSNAEVQRLRKENRALRGEEGAAGGGSQDFYTQNEILHSRRLAQELKAAATTAEHSLRQLLNGVDNLRIMASTLENLHRIEETSRESFFDLDDGTGPAL